MGSWSAAGALGRVGVLVAVAVPQTGQLPDPRQFNFDFDSQGLLESARPVERHEFTFTRAAYSGWSRRGWGWGSWATDYPKADHQFLIGVRRLTRIDAYEGDHALRLDDPELFRYPFIYAVEVGRMALEETEVEALRRYLAAGGFLFVDDFWGSRQWANFEHEIRRVLPGVPIVDLPQDHPIFHTVYDIDEILQVPNVNNGISGGPYWERDGFVPFCRGILDENGRLMVVINWNSDLGDAWEWAENPYYPLDRSTFAYQLGINAIVYAMTH